MELHIQGDLRRAKIFWHLQDCGSLSGFPGGIPASSSSHTGHREGEADRCGRPREECQGQQEGAKKTKSPAGYLTGTLSSLPGQSCRTSRGPLAQGLVGLTGVNEGPDLSPHGVTPKLRQEQGARMEAILGHSKERKDAAKKRKKS